MKGEAGVNENNENQVRILSLFSISDLENRQEMPFRFLLIYALLTCALAVRPHWVQAETEGDEVAKPFLGSTVRVELESSESGFGFVIGTSRDSVFIVTAAHVIQQKPGKTSAVRVYFHQSPWNPINATPLARNTRLDVALLKVDKPEGFHWNPQPTCTRYHRGDRVWWIGIGRQWSVPLDNVAGQLERSEPDAEDRISFAAMALEPGVSGAPLFTGDGIIGMIIEDSGPEGFALDIAKIRKYVTEQLVAWNLPVCITSIGMRKGGVSPSTPGSEGPKKKARRYEVQKGERHGDLPRQSRRRHLWPGDG